MEAALLPADHWLAHLLTHGKTTFNFHFVVNDMFMVMFFGIAGKEVAESFLPGGALSSARKAAMPVMATLGGVIGPILVFFTLYHFFGIQGDVNKAAWAVPTATDIAYCWLFARIIFGAAHPAVTFLLVLAVLDDLIGMLIIAFYYTPEVHPEWLLLLVAALVICEGMRRKGVKSFWPYALIGGTLSWFGLHNTGVHAALALVPIIPFMPHQKRDAGLFADEQGGDTMNRFEHFFAPIVDVGLFAFGLANAGVLLNAESFGGSITWTIFLSLFVGKTLGIFTLSWVGKLFGLSLPKPMTLPQVVVLGCVAGIGFTVALFVTTVALGLSSAQGWVLPEGAGDMMKLGALLSFAAGPVAWLLSKLLRVQKIDK
ncbi:Na+/H+ antiporter 1 superfamily [Verrucomicrobiia bacterium DG1235]|nr:Na+/H+ antiporter 1 superfamily [Verrucomicrobiae bacterium DG1235]